jgi:stage II sporulation protein P
MIILLTERRSTKIGAALLVFATVLRLLAGAPAWQGEGPITSIQKLPFVPTQAQTAPTAPTTPPPVIPRFTAEEAEKTQLRYSCDYRVDVGKLLEKDLQWQLSDGQPAVLIVHTHGSESYTKELGQNYKETAQYRTLDDHYNMVAVGDLLAQRLEAAGIRVIHDRQLHDYPSYTSSYNNSRKSVKAYLEEYPTIRLVLDLHRDAGENSDGSQFATHAKVDGQDSAQIMFLVGTDESGNYHPQWRDNLAVAAKLNVLMENLNPGITRKTTLRAQRFNQDLADIALLVEVGAAGNTLQEALTAIPILADAIIALKNGANW